MTLKKADGTNLQDYGLVDICNSHDFILIDTSAARDVSWIDLPREQRRFQMQFNVRYSKPLEQRIEYNALIGLLFVTKPSLFTTEKVLKELEGYAASQKGGLQKSIQQTINAIEHTPKLVSLEQTPEFEMYSEDKYLQRLAVKHGTGEVDQNLLLQFFASVHNIDGKCALITNDRGILDTYRAYGYKLPGQHGVGTALSSQKYQLISAGK